MAKHNITLLQCAAKHDFFVKSLLHFYKFLVKPNFDLEINSIFRKATNLFNLHASVFFHNLSPSFLWSTSWHGTLHSYSINFFIQSLSSFHSTCPYHRNLFCCSTEIMSPNPSLSLNPLLGTLSCSLTPHIHLTILISAR